MQGQIGGVNGFVVNIFAHYILSDKVVLELEKSVWRAFGGGGVAGIAGIAAFGSAYETGAGVAEGCDFSKR